MPLWSSRRWAPVQFRRPTTSTAPTARWPTPWPTWSRPAPVGVPPAPCACSPSCARWGWLFNPITIYWCDARDGSDDIVVLEVTNTPWHERHWYVLDAHHAGPFAKELHVSPFLPMDLTYRLQIDPDTQRPTARRLDVAWRLDTRTTRLRRPPGPGPHRAHPDPRRGQPGPPSPGHRERVRRHPRPGRRPVGQAGAVPPPPRRPPRRPARASARASAGTSVSPPVTDRAARAAVLGALSRLDSGRVVLREPGRRTRRYGTGRPDRFGHPALAVEVTVHDAGAYRAVLTGSSAGLGEAYARGSVGLRRPDRVPAPAVALGPPLRPGALAGSRWPDRCSIGVQQLRRGADPDATGTTSRPTTTWATTSSPASSTRP